MQVRRVVGVTRPGGRGSGYVVAPRLVLTSAHVTGPAGTAVRVFHPGRAGSYGGAVVWAGTPGGRDDAALVAVDDPAWEPPAGGVVRWGRTVTYRPGIRCESWGLPSFAQRGDRPAELWQPAGTLNPGDRYVGDRYVMTPDGPPPEAAGDGASPWEGMSGAALACDDLLAGVITADPARLAHARLEAVPAYVLLANPTFRRVLAEHTGRADQVLEPIEYQHLAEPAEPAGAQAASPAALLQPHRQVVPFHGREEILTRLHAWAQRPGFGACLVHAAGGQGKTRLARHLAGRLAGGGWAVVWLDARITAADLGAVKDAATPLLVVVDYAEARTEQVGALLEACARHDGASPVKILLLARTAGSWWQALPETSRDAEQLLDSAVVINLPALEPDADSRVGAYRQAAAAFAGALAALPGRQGHPWARLAATLPGPARRDELGNALTLHMTALAELLDCAAPAPDEPGTLGSDEGAEGAEWVEDRLLVHERRYWRTTATGRGLYPALSMETLTDALAAAVGWGAATGPEVDALMQRVPGLADQPADRRSGVRAWIGGLYPSATELPWGQLQPDRLAERFLGRHLENNADLADRLTPAASPAQATRLLTVYARAAAHPVFTHRLDEALTDLCVRHAEVLAVPAIQVATQVEVPQPLLDALHRLLSDPGIDAETLWRWHDQLPLASHALADWVAQLTARLADHSRHHADLPALVMSLSNLSVRLAALGRRGEALGPAAEAARICRRLAEAHPDAFLPDLAVILNNLSNRLAELGRREEALEVITEAATIRRRLAVARPDAFLPDLALSLNNLSIRLADLGRREEALEVIAEAVQIYRRLAGARPDVFLFDLSASLNNLSNRLADLGRREEALEAITEAVAIRRRLAEARPDAFLPDLAGSLNNLSNQLAELGRHEEVLKPVTEAVRIYRRLAGARPDAFLPDLALSLNNLSVRLAELGRREEALEVIAEAVAIRRRLAEARPDAFLPDLAGSLNNLSNRLAELGRHEDALEVIAEAVAIRRRLAEARPDAFLPDLAMSLSDFSNQLSDLGRHEEALDRVTEAARIYHRLAEVRPEVFLPGLAMSLNNLSNRLGDLGRREEALEAITEAVTIFHHLAATYPGTFLPRLAMSLNNLSNRLGDLGRREEALEAITEAVTIIRHLAKTHPSVYQENLEQFLRTMERLRSGA
ncbi:tetratricopeptide repeat protein [Streptosporangium sandarakinum]|uniref:tetratricopeptide repeat protein n=1 Tax=Streptosporangium sandarakinum TaxID=1260955 RepID=UPI0037BE1970